MIYQPIIERFINMKFDAEKGISPTEREINRKRLSMAVEVWEEQAITGLTKVVNYDDLCINLPEKKKIESPLIWVQIESDYDAIMDGLNDEE